MENKICVYAICKNEAKFVDRWVASMSEADYIVVLDTGSTDGTYEMLKENENIFKIKRKVIKPWRFDVARNESMTLVPDDANILVCTDLDEVFTDGWADKVRAAWQEDTTRCFYPYAWSHNSAGEPTNIYMYDKIHTRDYYWIYPVHEVLWRDSGQEIPVRIDDMMLHHYADKSKPRDYFDLLKVAVDENPDDPHIQELYAREFLNKNDIDSAMDEFKKVLEMPNVNKMTMVREKLFSMLKLAQLCAKKGDFPSALMWIQKFLEEDKTYRDPYYLMAEIFNAQGFCSMAIGAVEEGDKQGSQHFDWVEDGNTYTERRDDILSMSYYGLGDIDKAIDHCDKALTHVPDDVRLLKNNVAFLKYKIQNESSVRLNE